MLTRPRDRDVRVPRERLAHGRQGRRAHQDVHRSRPRRSCARIYHELGHVYYYLWYKEQPFLFQDGAHDGFHEAIGDTVNLSMTPAYLAKIGLVPARDAKSSEAVINQQMKMALDKIAFLPFGKLIDQWRWERVLGRDHAGRTTTRPGGSCASKYQGVAPPVPRSEADFDPGAKYHVPGNTPYTRYFLSFILQFQFHKALCEAAGFKGPLHECSIYGNKEAGRAFRAMLALGREPAVAGRAREADRHAPDGCVGDPRILPAADAVARGAEQGPAVRLDITRTNRMGDRS